MKPGPCPFQPSKLHSQQGLLHGVCVEGVLGVKTCCLRAWESVDFCAGVGAGVWVAVGPS